LGGAFTSPHQSPSEKKIKALIGRDRQQLQDASHLIFPLSPMERNYVACTGCKRDSAGFFGISDSIPPLMPSPQSPHSFVYRKRERIREWAKRHCLAKRELLVAVNIALSTRTCLVL